MLILSEQCCFIYSFFIELCNVFIWFITANLLSKIEVSAIKISQNENWKHMKFSRNKALHSGL